MMKQSLGWCLDERLSEEIETFTRSEEEVEEAFIFLQAAFF